MNIRGFKVTILGIREKTFLNLRYDLKTMVYRNLHALSAQ